MNTTLKPTDGKITGWENFWKMGLSYKSLSEKAQHRREKFTPDLLYNISAMAIENLVMGFLSYKGSLPENHALRDLVRGLEKEITLDKGLKMRILSMDRYQEICSMIMYNRRIPHWDDVGEFVLLSQDCLPLKLFQNYQNFKLSLSSGI